MAAETQPGTAAVNGVKAVGEVFVPGASLVLDGNVKGAATHVVAGLVAKALIGPIGWGLVAADSFSVSVSGKSLYDHFTSK